MLSEKELNVIQTLIEDEMGVVKTINDDNVVKSYVDTLKNISSKLYSDSVIPQYM